MATLPVNLKGRTGVASLGSGGTYTLDPSVGVVGTPLAVGDFLFVVLAASGSTPRVPLPGPGWVEVVPYQVLSTQAWGLWVRERGAGETTYTGTLQTGGDVTRAQFWWGSGHDVIANWIVGSIFTRSGSTTQNVAPSINTTDPQTLALVVSSERTTAAETDAQVSVTGTGWTKDLFDNGGTSSFSSLTIGHRDMPTPGATGAATVTYPNSHAANGIAVQIGIPPPPDTAFETTLDLSGHGEITFTTEVVGSTPLDFTGHGEIEFQVSAVESRPLDLAGHGEITFAVTPPLTPIEQWIAEEPYFVAHRGRSAPGLQPEETMHAYQSAVDWGVPALEISVWRSSDGVWVCSHDSTTGRVFNQNHTIGSTSWATLQNLTTQTGGHPIARIEEILDAFQGSHIIIVENKPTASYSSWLDLLETYPDAQGRILIKHYFDNDAAADLAHARGFKTWGYYFDADVNDATTYPDWDYMTLNFDATQTQWNTLLGTGRKVAAHVCQTTADAIAGFNKGAHGIMAADFVAIVPGTAETTLDLDGHGEVTFAVTEEQTRTLDLDGHGDIAFATVPELSSTLDLDGAGQIDFATTVEMATALDLAGQSTLAFAVTPVLSTTLALEGHGEVAFAVDPTDTEETTLDLAGHGEVTFATVVEMSTVLPLAGQATLTFATVTVESRPLDLAGAGQIGFVVATEQATTLDLSGHGEITFVVRQPLRVAEWTGTEWIPLSLAEWDGTVWTPLQLQEM